MAFKIEDLLFSITITAENKAVMNLAGCGEQTAQVLFASCGKTQQPCNGAPALAANALDGKPVVAFRPTIDHLEILRGELRDMLEAVEGVHAAALALVAQDGPDGDDEEVFNPPQDLGGAAGDSVTLHD